MKVRGIDFVAYEVSDIEQSIVFYRDKLGLEMDAQPMHRWAELRVPPTTLALYQPEGGLPSEKRGRSGAIALAVEDVSQAVEELRAQEVPIYMEPMDTPVCWIAMIADPDGNRIMLHQRKDGSFG